MKHCRLCKNEQIIELINFGKHPIAHHLLEKTDEIPKKYELELSFCRHCGLFQIINPIPPNILYKNYYSLTTWKNQSHMPLIIKMLEQTNAISKNDKILEIGCNDGVFLAELKNRGYEKIIGIEPALDAYTIAKANGFHVINDFLTEDTSLHLLEEYDKFDLVIVRHVLEHIQNLDDFIKGLNNILKNDGYVLFEVPDFTAFLDYFDYTVWEEHVNYFVADTMNYFFNLANLEMLKYEKVIFSGVSLVCIVKRKDKIKSMDNTYLKLLTEKAEKYKDNWLIFKNRLNRYLESEIKKGKNIAVYGAGARLCNLINFTGIKDKILFIVDDQYEKQNKYLPGSMLPILSSDNLIKKDIDICLLAVNYENENKVIDKHMEFSKKGGKFYSVLPPSDIMLPVWNNL